MAESFYHLFVNRRAYTLQSTGPHPETGRHYYYRPRARDGEAGLSLETVQQHLAGELTLGIYVIHPHTQRSKWVAIDADYKNALVDLVKLQHELQQDGVEPALEKSNRGGHLWIFFEQPALARDCRVYIYHTALRLGLPIKGAGLPDEQVVRALLLASVCPAIAQSKKADRSKFALNVVAALLVVGVAAAPVLVLLVAAEWRVFMDTAGTDSVRHRGARLAEGFFRKREKVK
jgi:hypothetical protein